MNWSAKGGARSSLHYEGEGVLIHPPHQGVGRWHGTEERCVTSGGLAESAGGTGVSRPISASEVASDALPDGMDRVEAGRLAWVGDQSGENARGAFEGRRSESGLSGIHVPLLR